MDKIEKFTFNGSFQKLIMDAVIRDVTESILLNEEPKELLENEFPWLDFKIQAVIARRTQSFDCQFKIVKHGDDFYAQFQFEEKGFFSKRFAKLMDKERELFSTTILEFATLEISELEEFSYA